MKKLFVLSLLLITWISVSAQSDSLGVADKKSERNMMLNAESASAPREINIGLPEEGGGASVYIDRLSHGSSLPRSQYHWAGGNFFITRGSVGLMEAVITDGEIAVLLDSRTRLGGDQFEGAITIGSSTNGLVRFDGALGGPIKNAKGWYYSFGAYVNNDPTNVNAPNRPFVDQKQIYILRQHCHCKKRTCT